MKPYSAYTAEELALDDLFVRWVQHPGDAEVDAFWQNWIHQHPYRSDTVDTARFLVRELSTIRLRRMGHDDVSSLWGRIRESLQDMEEVRPLQPEVRSFIAWWYFIRTVGAAAGIILFIGWALWMQYAEEGMQTIRTTAGLTQTVRLPDGSTAFLHRNSQLRFSRQWTSDAPRAVWLQGEADFMVIHTKGVRAEGLFRVHTPDLTVEATGTTFRVQQQQQGTRVVLKEGQVKLLLSHYPEPVQLRPGDSVDVSSGRIQPIDRRPLAERD
ncbi:hypothetical protein GCM10023187_17020 [Nibrella viscosa]|uniref:FecR protein domain-containing protein n=1 Tax=Nibrella viscosa TaxID=1084524 RepID=A0ABP8K849_9BACT